MNGIIRPIDPWNGLRVSAAIKMELGEFAANLDDLDENSKRFDDAFMFTFSMPLELGLLIYPQFFFGAGIELFAGTDLMNLRSLFSGYQSYADKTLDYKIRAGYSFMTSHMVLSAHATWEHRSYGLISHAKDDIYLTRPHAFFARHNAFGITLAADLNFAEIF